MTPEVGFEFHQNLKKFTKLMHYWKEFRRFHTGNGISSTCFDPAEDLLWAGATDGQLTSYLNTVSHGQFSRYTSYPSNSPSPVSQIIASEAGVYSCGLGNIRFLKRQGITKWNRMLPNTSCMALSESETELCYGTTDGQIEVLDTFKGILKHSISECEIGIVSMLSGKYLITGTTSGAVVLRDPNSRKTVHQAIFHSGGVSSMDLSGSYLVTTGFTQRSLIHNLVALAY